MSPRDSTDLTEIVIEDRDKFVALRSSDAAEHCPRYQELGRFETRGQAERFLATRNP